MTQFYLPYLQESDEYVMISREEDEFLHIVKSHRVKKNEIIQVFNGQGLVFKLKVDEISKSYIRTTVVEKNYYEKDNYSIFVCIGIFKIDRFEISLEKLTEVGATDIIPLNLENSIINENTISKKYNRFNKIIIEASKQSDRKYFPILHPVKKLQDIFSNSVDELKIVLYKNSQLRFLDIKEKIKQTKNIKLLIGPEGDFSQREITFLKHQKNTFNVTLGDNILRTETSSIIAASVIYQIKNNLL